VKKCTLTIFVLLCSKLVIAETSGENIHKNNEGGWVIAGSDENPNWANCKCPMGNLPTCTDDNDESENWPTRCLKENVDREYKVPVVCYKNRKNRGKREILVYPSYNESPPHELSYKVHKGYPPGLGRLNPGDIIPFPGWPAEKKRVSEWNKKKLRAKYIKRYKAIADENVKPPGFVAQGYGKKNKTGFDKWQIHHILEQKHAGVDTWDNMVPVYSRKGTDNNHQKYTSWWQKVKVDSEFKNDKKHKETWKKIQKCKYIQWPKKPRDNIKDWSPSP
jgi:hypothetical protein